MKSKTLASLAVIALAASIMPILLHKTAIASGGVPRFEFDASWPKPLPKNWMLGAIGGNFVDSHDHIWVANRPGSLDNNDKYAALDRRRPTAAYRRRRSSNSTPPEI